MTDKYMCIHCKCAGAKTLLSFKIIEDKDGQSIKFRGQLCERCFKELFDSPPDNKEQEGESNE